MVVGITVCIFLGTILSKMTVLLAAGNVLQSKERNLYCIQYNFTYSILNGTENVTEYYAKCITKADDYNVSNSDSCLDPDSAMHEVYQPGQEYSVCDAVSIRWIWCLTLILITPNFFVFCRSFWIYCFKNEKWPSLKLFLVVCIWQFSFLMNL